MNPFVNPKKRDISLPSGCKDLADVLRLPVPKTGDPVQTFIRTVLLQAEGVRASEVLIGAPMIYDGECSVTRRIGCTLYPVTTISSGFRSRMVAELLKMAALTQAHFPIEGLVCVQQRQLKWKIQIEGTEADCVLTPVASAFQK